LKGLLGIKNWFIMCDLYAQISIIN
jgi:hypothetical protein